MAVKKRFKLMRPGTLMSAHDKRRRALKVIIATTRIAVYDDLRKSIFCFWPKYFRDGVRPIEAHVMREWLEYLDEYFPFKDDPHIYPLGQKSQFYYALIQFKKYSRMGQPRIKGRPHYWGQAVEQIWPPVPIDMARVRAVAAYLESR